MKLSFLLLSCFFLASCTAYPTPQPQVQALLLTRQYDQAMKVLDEHKRNYGAKNELLYLMDRGLVLHWADRSEESAVAFEQAKLRYDELYTQSISRHAASWLMNDYMLPYRGEDFERVMISLFQAMNYVKKGHVSEALVEARDVNSVLTVINQRYPADQ